MTSSTGQVAAGAGTDAVSPARVRRDGAPRPSALGLLACCALVALAVAAVHRPVLEAQGQALDDHVLVRDNPLVMHPGWASTWRFFTEVLDPSTVRTYYLPLSMTSLMLDAAVGGRPSDLTVFHRTNLVLHVLNATLVVLLGHAIFGSLIPAAMVALLFGLHPLVIEPIASVGERKTLLATCFALASILVYVRYAKGGVRGLLTVAIAFFGLALLSKPSVTTLPLLLLLLDIWPLGRLSRRAVVEKWPFLALSIVSGAITAVSVARAALPNTWPEASPARAFLLVNYVLAFDLRTMLWPAALSPIYAPPRPVTLSNPAILASLIVVGAVVLVFARAWRRSRAPLVGAAFFVVALAPTFGILAWSSIATYDRFLYFPAFGILLPLAAGMDRAWRTWPAGARVALAAFVCVALAAEARTAQATLAHWKDSITIWRHIVAHAPGRAESHYGLGGVHQERFDFDEALREYRISLQADPSFGDARLSLGILLANLGQSDEALRHLEMVRASNPRSGTPAFHLGVALRQAGRMKEAEDRLRLALVLDPDNVDATTQLGVVRVLQGHADDGLEWIARALALAPDDAQAHLSMAVMRLQTRGIDREVLGHLRAAMRARPSWSPPANQLAWLLATTRDPNLRDAAEALALARMAVSLSGGRDPNVLDTQAAALAAAGRFEEAARDARAALELAPAESLARAIRGRLVLYERRTPYIEPAPARR
jgi:protein O-mannosyl-transferase